MVSAGKVYGSEQIGYKQNEFIQNCERNLTTWALLTVMQTEVQTDINIYRKDLLLKIYTTNMSLFTIDYFKT